MYVLVTPTVGLQDPATKGGLITPCDNGAEKTVSRSTSSSKFGSFKLLDFACSLTEQNTERRPRTGSHVSTHHCSKLWHSKGGGAIAKSKEVPINR